MNASSKSIIMTETVDRRSGEVIPDRAAITEETIRKVVDLATELGPRRSEPLTATVNSDLDRDLGFDSLGRAELVRRLDRAFAVRLPDRLIADARTPGDLVDAILAAEPVSIEPAQFLQKA